MKLYYKEADINVEQLAARCIHQLKCFQDNLMGIRDKVHAITGRDTNDVILDIQLSEFEKYPKKVIKEMYAFINKELSEDFEMNLNKYIREKSVSLLTNNKAECNDIARYGYTQEQIIDTFSTYTSQYNIPLY